MEVIGAFETRHGSPEAGALLAWACWTVDCLYYLDDVDRAFDTSDFSAIGHRPDVVDVAHARWATSSCITALDLCAAALGRALCSHSGPRELDLGDFDSSGRPSPQVQARRNLLPQSALAWVDNVLADQDYSSVKSARNWLTHSRLKRHFVLDTNGPPKRISLEVDSNNIPVRQLVEIASDSATRWVSDLMKGLPAI